MSRLSVAQASLDCDPGFWASRAQATVSSLLAGPIVGIAGPYMPSAFRGAEWCTAPIITISPRLALRAATSNDDASEPLCKDERSADDDPFDLLACAKLCAAHSMGLDECLIARGSVGSVSLEAAIRRSHRRLVTSFGDRVQVLGTTPNGVSSRVYRRDLIRRILSAPVAPCAASVGATALRPPPSVAELQLGWARSSAASADGTQAKPPRLPFYLHEFEEGRRQAVWIRRQALAGRDLDRLLPLSASQYLTDVFLLDALSRHADRVGRPSDALLHVLAIPAHASQVWATSKSTLRAGQGQARHLEMMASVAAKVRLLKRALLPDAQLLVVMGFFYPQLTLGPALIDALQDANTILCTSDPDFAAHAHLNERAVVIPYRAMGSLEAAAFEARALSAPWPASKRFAFTLHADMSRADRGVRAMVRAALELFEKRASPSGGRVSLKSAPVGRFEMRPGCCFLSPAAQAPRHPLLLQPLAQPGPLLSQHACRIVVRPP